MKRVIDFHQYIPYLMDAYDSYWVDRRLQFAFHYHSVCFHNDEDHSSVIQIEDGRYQERSYDDILMLHKKDSRM